MLDGGQLLIILEISWCWNEAEMFIMAVNYFVYLPISTVLVLRLIQGNNPK